MFLFDKAGMTRGRPIAQASFPCIQRLVAALGPLWGTENATLCALPRGERKERNPGGGLQVSKQACFIYPTDRETKADT